MKLVQHVCRHIDVPTVLSDALLLCDAFTISKLDTCVLLVQRTMVTPNNLVRSSALNRVEQCASLLLEMYSVDAMLAEAVGERMAGFCAIVLEDCKKMILRKTFVVDSKRQAMVATTTACALLSVMRDHGMRKQFCSYYSCGAHVAASNLLEAFQKVSKLQSGCDIFLTLNELKDPACCATVVSDLLLSVDVLLSRRVVSEMEEDYLRDELRRLVATARQWCTILCETPSEVSQMWSRVIGIAACRVAKISTNHASILLLEVSGLLHEQTGHSSFHAIMSVALTLCARSVSEAHHLLSSTSQDYLHDETHLLPSLISMRCMAQASQLLREHILLHSPPCRLSSSLSFANLAELICEISIRSDMGIGERLEKYIDTLKSVCRKIHQQSDAATGKPFNMLADKRFASSPNLHPTWYIGDGLLLQPFEALGISMLYWKVMLDIETKGYCESDLGSSNPLAEESQTVQSLESSGAHAIAHRVIMLSATTSMCQISSSCSESLMSGSVEIILRKYYRVLAERSLGGTDLGLTSGTVDALMSVSFLLHLPKEMAFKVSEYFHIIITLFMSDCILTCTSVNFNISRSTKHHCRRL